MPDGGSERLEGFRRFIEEHTEQLARPYLTRIADVKPGTVRKKEINDAVWGTLGLEPHEIVVLDSPVLQRLQRIRQLGVVHLVYPSARHSRFEHCIGVMHQVSRIVDAVNEAGSASGVRIDQKIRRTLRLAALSHDIGHGVMSHVSENAINTPDVVRLRVDFQRAANTDSERQLSEIAAYYMVRSPAFTELLRHAARIGSVAENDLRADHIADAIIGKMFDRKFPMAQELISGPFDADKMDYMARDARMTGIPVVTDFTRLTQKLRAAQIPPTQLPGALARVVPDGGAVLVVGVTRTGRRALDEMALGRALMFDKVYRHHKVRAGEMMVKAIINAGLRHVGTSIEQVPYLLHDEQLLDVTATWLEQRATVPVDDSLRAEFGIAADIASRLRERNLFVRAYEFGITAETDTQKHETEGSEDMDRLLRRASDFTSNEQLVRDIAAEAASIADAIGEQPLLDSFGGAHLWHYIKVDPPRAGDISAEASTARTYLIEDGGATALDNSVARGTNAWAEAYTNIRNLGFVFSPRELAPIVHVAAELVIRGRVGMQPYTVGQLVSMDRSTQAQEIKRRLEDAAYTSESAGAVRAESERLQQADMQRLLAETADHYATYSPPSITGDEDDAGLSVERITAWLVQFPDHLMHAALLMASAVRVLARVDATRSIRAFQKAYPDFTGFNLTPVGEAKDGSAIIGYFGRDAKRSDGSSVPVLNITQALDEDAPILFIDDFIGKGNSTITILRGWLGVKGDIDLHEDRRPLPPEYQEKLREREIGFAYLSGLDTGEQALRDELAKLGFTARVSVFIPERQIPTIDTLRDDSPDEPWDDLQAFLGDVAQQTLRDEDPAHDDDWVGEKTLGYGNGGRLLASTFNTPTVTVTAMWRAGEYNGLPWTPLLPRRKKD